MLLYTAAGWGEAAADEARSRAGCTPVMIREVDGCRAPKDSSQGHQGDVRFETLPVHMMLFHLIDALLFRSIDMIHIWSMVVVKKKALTYNWLYVPAMGAGRCSAQRCRPAKPPSAALWTWARIWTPTWVLCVFQAFSTSPPLVFHSICLKPMQSDLIRSGCVLLCTHKTCLGGRR